MAVYVVSCALRDMQHDYAPFWHALERAGARRAMEAVWLLESEKTIEQITSEILPQLTSEDRLLVAHIGSWSATRLLDDTGPWLKGRLP